MAHNNVCDCRCGIHGAAAAFFRLPIAALNQNTDLADPTLPVTTRQRLQSDNVHRRIGGKFLCLSKGFECLPRSRAHRTIDRTRIESPARKEPLQFLHLHLIATRPWIFGKWTGKKTLIADTKL
jgi:hypothetical protein